MKKYALPLLCVVLAGYGSLSFAAEPENVVVDEVPEAVKEMNKLSWRDQRQQDKEEKEASENFNTAAESAAQKDPS
ncbi:MAG: hypothetical protein ACJAYE_002033 [Candidatus Azotimanducaceae bacterium]|jgi:hypothetical protein